MGASRETQSLWNWIRAPDYGQGRKWKFPEFIKRKLWRGRYFWHDTLGKYLWRWFGCPIAGHKRIQNIADNPSYEDLHCFNCERRVNP